MRRFPLTSRFVLRIAVVLALLELLGAYASAQIDRGVIVGRVVDSSGAVIPRANIVVTNKDTGVTETTTSNDAGEYQVLALNPGRYSVKISASGFETVVRDDLVLHVQDRLSIDATMKPGAATQEVVVTGQEPLLHTETAD